MGAKLGDPPVAVKALILVSVGHEGGDDSPFFREIKVELYEVLIFLWSPCLDFSFFGVEVFLFDLKVDFKAIESLDGLGKLSWLIFFHIYTLEE